MSIENEKHIDAISKSHQPEYGLLICTDWMQHKLIFWVILFARDNISHSFSGTHIWKHCKRKEMVEKGGEREKNKVNFAKFLLILFLALQPWVLVRMQPKSRRYRSTYLLWYVSQVGSIASIMVDQVALWCTDRKREKNIIINKIRSFLLQTTPQNIDATLLKYTQNECIFSNCIGFCWNEDVSMWTQASE